MKKDHRDNVVGPWAEEKLTTLEKYLSAYTLALKNQRFRLIYIDAFAGSPLVRIRLREGALDEPNPFLGDEEAAIEQEQYIVGSPVRALRCDPPFHRYFFFDLDKTRAGELANLAAGDARVTVRIGNCNPALRELANDFRAWNDRGIAFLDPYGAHLEWATLEALASTGKIEVVINFPVAMAINRLIKKDANIPDSWSSQLDACFGTAEWRSQAYREVTDLWGNTSPEKVDGTAGRLLDLYRRRLRDLFAFVGPSWEVCNTRNVPLYYLIWAGPNERGYAIAKDVFSKYKPLGRTLRRKAR